MTANNAATIAAGIATDGAIQKLPGMGRRQVNLSEFTRVGLAHLANKSFIRNAPRLQEVHDTTTGADSVELPTTLCASCERSFGDIAGYTITDKTIASYQIVKFVPATSQTRNGKPSYAGNDAYMVCFCFDCAMERDNMVRAIANHKYANMFAPTIAEDGQDVYAFVAQTIVEDRLHGTAGYENVELRMLAGGYYGGGDGINHPKAFYHSIGGRLLAHRLNVLPRQSADDARAERAIAKRVRAAERAERAAMTQDAETPDASVTDDSSVSDDTPETPATTPTKRTRKPKYA